MRLRQEIRHLKNVKWNNEREIYRLTNKLREAEHLLEKERSAHMNIGVAIKSLEEVHKVQSYSVKVNVLGTQYTVIFDTLAENNRYKQCAGYCDLYAKEVHVRSHTHEDADRDSMTIPDDSIKILENKSLRHELVHAFMFESGLDVNSNDIDQWARNEEMVDWMAIQMPKIMAAYESVIDIKSCYQERVTDELPSIPKHTSIPECTIELL